MHKLIVRKSPLAERETEGAITIVLLLLAFAAASSSQVIPFWLAIGIAVILLGICVVLNICLQIRHHKRRVPRIIDTANRWICAKETVEAVESHLDYCCEILRSEHRKGPTPKVSILDGDHQASEFRYLVKTNEAGDVRIYFSPKRLKEISSTPPVKVSISGD